MLYVITIATLLLGKTVYTHEEILSILSGDEWTSDEIN